MLSHVTVGVREMSRALAFYEPLMEALSLSLKFATPDWAAWVQPGQARPLFIITRPVDCLPATAGNGPMVAFMAASRALVDRSYEVALRNGGTSEGTPGLRPHDHPDFYGAYVRDPDGNKLCIACHDPEPAASSAPTGRLGVGAR